MKRRHQLWLMLVALVLGFGWYKSTENRREAEAQTAWRDEIARLEAASRTRFEELQVWTPELHKATDPKRLIAAELNDGQPLAVDVEGDRETITWRHPEYGIEMVFGFSNGTLVSLGSTRSSAAVEQATPPPPSYAHSGKLESFRRAIPPYAAIAWLITLCVAVVSWRYGVVAAEAMVVITLACGTAWLVSPLYNLNLQGIFSNDSLFFALLMYLFSLGLLAFRLLNDRLPRFQFRLRTLLVITSLVAILLALGQFGYVALAAISAGAVFLWIAVWLRQELPTDNRVT